MAQAKQADQEIAAGHYRGPLHGIPWGGKDLLDTAGIPTTYGAEPFRNRVPAEDAAVVKRLNQAGAVLIAKLSMGALATERCVVWRADQKSLAAAGRLVGLKRRARLRHRSRAGGLFHWQRNWRKHRRSHHALRNHRPAADLRQGSADRRHDLCWSLDKLGPMTRSVEDSLLVLEAITGPDPGDVSSVPSKLDYDAAAKVEGLRVGYFPKWMHEAPATDVDRAALETVKKLGMVPVEVSIPDWPYDSLQLILVRRSSGRLRGADAHPWRRSTEDAGAGRVAQHFSPGALSFRGGFCPDRSLPAQGRKRDGRVFSQVDLLLVPSLRDEMLDHHQRYGPSLAHFARRLYRGF